MWVNSVFLWLVGLGLEANLHRPWSRSWLGWVNLGTGYGWHMLRRVKIIYMPITELKIVYSLETTVVQLRPKSKTGSSFVLEYIRYFCRRV